MCLRYGMRPLCLLTSGPYLRLCPILGTMFLYWVYESSRTYRNRARKQVNPVETTERESAKNVATRPKKGKRRKRDQPAMANLQNPMRLPVGTRLHPVDSSTRQSERAPKKLDAWDQTPVDMGESYSPRQPNVPWWHLFRVLGKDAPARRLELDTGDMTKEEGKEEGRQSLDSPMGLFVQSPALPTEGGWAVTESSQNIEDDMTLDGYVVCDAEH